MELHPRLSLGNLKNETWWTQGYVVRSASGRDPFWWSQGYGLVVAASRLIVEMMCPHWSVGRLSEALVRAR
jgi:hypothetical protein